MFSPELLTDSKELLLERFTRFEYKNAFEGYKLICLEVLVALENNEQVSAAVDDLLNYAESKSSGIFRKNIELDKFCRLFALYLVPAARTSESPMVQCFAERLCARWNERFPKHAFSMGSYEEIASGFRTKPFGMG